MVGGAVVVVGDEVVDVVDVVEVVVELDEVAAVVVVLTVLVVGSGGLAASPDAHAAIKRHAPNIHRFTTVSLSVLVPARHHPGPMHPHPRPLATAATVRWRLARRGTAPRGLP